MKKATRVSIPSRRSESQVGDNANEKVAAAVAPTATAAASTVAARVAAARRSGKGGEIHEI